MSQDRMQASHDTPSVFSTDGGSFDVDQTLQQANAATMAKVRVVHGVHDSYFENLEGKTVGAVRKSLRDVFNIPGDADALVEGKEVGDDFILEKGMQLEFQKDAGVKGV